MSNEAREARLSLNTFSESLQRLENEICESKKEMDLKARRMTPY